MAEATAKLTILTQLRDEASNAMRSVANSVSDLGGNLGFAGEKSDFLAGGLAYLGSQVIGSAISAFEDANLKLLTSQRIFEALPDGVKKYAQALEVGNQMQQRFGFDNEAVTLALAKFARATGGDMDKALLGLNAAMGLAIDKFGGPGGLETAVNAILPVFAGGGRAVKALGFELDDHASAVTALTTVYNATKPSLEAFGESAKGMGAKVKEAGSNILEDMGSPLVFVKDKFLELIGINGSLGDAINSLTPLWQGLGVGITAVTTILTVQALPALLTKLATTLGLVAAGTEITIGSLVAFIATWGLVVLAIAAVIAVGILVVKHWDYIRENLKAAWELIKINAEAIWTKIAQFFKDVGATIVGFFVDMWSAIAKGWDAFHQFITIKIPSILLDIVNFFASLPGKVVDVLAALPNRVFDIFSRAGQNIKGVFSDVINFIAAAPGSLVDFGKGAINGFISVVNGFVRGFNSVASYVGIHIPEIPKFAQGGIVTRPTLGLIGEAGPEAVVPLNRLGGAGGFGSTINVYLQGDFYTDTETAEKFANQIARLIGYQVKLI